MKSFSFQLNRRGLITLLMAMLFALPAFSQKMAASHLCGLQDTER